MKHGLLTLALLALHIMRAAGAEIADEKSPASGSWHGFKVGTFTIVKKTYHGVSYHADGVEYTKTVLAGVSDRGAGQFQDFTALAATGPWKMSAAHGGDGPPEGLRGERTESQSLAEEDVSAGAQRIRCSVTVKITTDDWGKLTTKEWTDKQSGVVLRRERVFAGQDPKGKPAHWTASLVTTGMEKRSVSGVEFDCFVQEHQWSPEMGGQWSRTWATAKLPEGRVAMVSGKSKQAQPELEFELVELGRDTSILASVRESSPLFFKERMLKDKEEEKHRSERLENEMVANLASGEKGRMLAAMNAVTQWADIIPPPVKAKAIEALLQALDHPAVEVRREAGQALGKLGAKGLSTRLAEMLQSDPGGTYQYFEALGMQADTEAFRAILARLASADENHRRAATSALRFFKGAEAREALETALTDRSSQVRLAAVESLKTIADPQCVPAVVRLLHDENPMVVAISIRVICTLGDDAAVPPLLELLAKPGNEARTAICLWIGKMRLARPSVVGDSLIPLLDDADPRIRFGATASLGAFREKRAVPRLLQIVQEPVDLKAADPWIRPQAMAFIALGEIGDPSAIPKLAKLLETPEASEAAAEALVKIGDAAAAPFLFDHYVRTAGDEKFDRGHRKVIEALGKLGTATTRTDLENYLTKCQPIQKTEVRRAIQGIDERLPR